MKSSSLTPLLFVLIMLIMAGLACQTLMNPDEIFGVESIPTFIPPIIESPSSNPLPSPTPPPGPSSRLSGQNLPELTFNPPGESISVPNRPSLSGTPQTLDTLHFRIHYTLAGDDAVPRADGNSNRHPDYVEDVAIALEYAWITIVDHFEWSAPPPDEGLAGDDRYDVYLENIFEDGTAGYTEGGFDDTFVGDNPNSSILESNSSFSFMALDNDFAEIVDYSANGVNAIQFMRTTAAHEFLHAIQYGYDGDEPLEWLWEATASWVQDEIFDDYNDNLEDLNAVFKAPDSCQLAYVGEDRSEDDNHWYGLWAFIRFLSESYGHNAVRELWEAAVSLNNYEIWDEVLSKYQTSMQDFFRSYSVALLTRNFEEGANYPQVRLEGEASSASIFTPNNGVGQLGADYVRIHASGITTINLEAANLEGLLVALSADQQSHLFPLINGRISFNADNYEYLYLLVLNQARTNREPQCRFSTYTISIQEGGNPSAPSSSRPAPNFESPSVEALRPLEEQSGEGNAVAEPPADLALIYVPENYDFIESYTVTRADFWSPDNVDYYIPADVNATNLDYYGPGKDDILFVLASESPFDTLENFFVHMNFSPQENESFRLSGVPVVIEDWTDAKGPYSNAIFIVDGLFVVIEGSIQPSEMRDVVKSWITG